jgi:hypothetical protein
MGPIGKILQDVKRGNWDVDALSGYVLNIHSNNRKAKVMSDFARDNLEEGIAKLLSLLKTVPITAQDKVLELIDYGLYYERRKKIMLHFEIVKEDWISFLKENYKTGQALADAWKEKLQNIGENFVSKVVRPVTRSRIRKVLTNHNLFNALSVERTMIEDDIKQELRDSLSSHGLFVENFYLSSLNPVDGGNIEETKAIEEVTMPKNEEEIRSQRIFSRSDNKIA